MGIRESARLAMACQVKEANVLKVVQRKRFDGYGSEVEMNMLWEYLRMVEGNYDVQLFEVDRIIKLDIPHSEIWHRCTDEEWDEVLKFVEKHLSDT